MNLMEELAVPIRDEGDIVAARRAVRDAAKKLGFGITDTTRIVTAASELARNIHRYARSGVMRGGRLDSEGRVGIELHFEDQGPGIANVELGLLNGFPKSGGLGIGLRGTKRLMDEMEIRTEPGRGTAITIRKWRLG
jgi:serine/threonine-protein kinase RsbT